MPAAAKAATTGIKFEDPALVKQREIISQLRSKDRFGRYVCPIVYDEVVINGKSQAVIHVSDPNKPEKYFSFVTIPTQASRQEVQEIVNKVSWIKEACFMVECLAKAYKNGRLVGLEGPSAIGKTFISKVFSKCIHGAKFKLPILTCNEGTSESELLGGVAPETGAASSSRAYKFVPGIFEKMYHGTIDSNGGVTVDTDQPGSGCMVLIDELTRAKPKLTNAFFPLRGDGRKLNDHIQISKDDGRLVKKGQLAFCVFSQNPVDDGNHVGVHAFDEALLRAIDFVTVPELSMESLQIISEDMLRFKRGDKPDTSSDVVQPFDYSQYEDLVRTMGSALRLFHIECGKVMERYQKSRDQKIIVTVDDFAQVAQELLTSQVRDFHSGQLDFVQTLTEAVNSTYITRVGEAKVQKELRELWDRVLSNKELFSVKGTNSKCYSEEIAKLAEMYSVPADRLLELESSRLTSIVSALAEDEVVPDAIKNLFN